MAKRLKGIPNLPFAPIAAAMFALVAAILVMATPEWRIEQFVAATGIAKLVPAAKPPLGDTARTLLAIAVGLASFAGLWLAMRPIEKMVHARRTKTPKAVIAGSAQPIGSDAITLQPGRRPIFANEELGAPFMSEEALASGEELLLDAPEAEAPVIDDIWTTAPTSTVPATPAAEPAIDVFAATTPVDTATPPTPAEVPLDLGELERWVPGPSPAEIEPQLDIQPPMVWQDLADDDEPVPFAPAVSEAPHFDSPVSPIVPPVLEAVESAELTLTELVERLEAAIHARAASANKSDNVAALHDLLERGRKLA